jgi:Fe-S-cluster containining protein
MMKLKPCGECGKCCQLLGVPKVKERNCRCPHWASGKGCNIYKTRPKPCANFDCYWRADQLMTPAMRPDKLGVMFWQVSSHSHRLVAHVWRSGAWDQEPVQQVVDDWLDAGPPNMVLRVDHDLAGQRDIQIIARHKLTPEEVRSAIYG